MTTQELIKDAIGKAFKTLKKKSAIYSNGTEIPANADLDDYTTPGVYHSAHSATTDTLSHVPMTGSAFKLIVLRAGYASNAYLMQIWIRSVSTNMTNSFWARTTNGSGVWGDWAVLSLADQNSLFIYASTYAELYEHCQKIPTGRTATFLTETAASKAISNDGINGTFKGTVTRISSTAFDFFGSSLGGDHIYTIRATLTGTGATIQYMQRMVMPSTSSPLIKRVTYSAAYSGLAANSNKTLTADDFNISTPSGYLPLAASYVMSGNSAVIVRFYVATNTKTTSSKNIMDLRNVSSSAQSGTAAITINYIRSEAING